MKHLYKILVLVSSFCAAILLGNCLLSAAIASDPLAKGFLRPPDSARPWVYWFWLNGNITSNGIMADLEAMKRVGIGGVLIMEVDQGAPLGPVRFMSPQWQSLFKHVVAEARRLGLEVNMNDDAGWNGSGGPWIRPEQSMQKVVCSETNLEGPRHFTGVLTQPQTVAGFYRDIAVQAFPAVGAYRIDRIHAKACYEVGAAGVSPATNLPPGQVIDPAQLVELTARMDSSGHLEWDVPPGKWTVLRFGHTSTGVENAPSPASGRGLECDKLSREGCEANFAGMMDKLIADVGAGAGRTLVTTHIDSWENGAQNWTARMRDEFTRRLGYDPLLFLPVMTGRVMRSLEVSERFLWDLRQTVSDLVVENYAGHMRELARRHGLKLSIEAYGGPCDDLPYAGRADEPMCEFWMGGGAMQTCREMASAAHIYGKPILGAEAFTAGDQERWQEHPASIKALGDRAFCEGVNRFVFHRYALQPWAQDRRPGMTMGPWGLHYERTQTWWDWTPRWHQYLARCQFLLRQGRFVADLCYLQPESAPQGLYDHERTRYDFDNCSAEVVLTRMNVNQGRLTLPDGMSYRLLVLPESRTMTPRLLRKIRDLVQAGATVVGPRPIKSPSLAGYPQCDEEVQSLAAELWGDCDGNSITEHRFGQGRVLWGVPVEKVLAASGVPPDFTSRPRLRYIHRATPDTDIFFVANSQPYSLQARCEFRVSGKRPELWWPETGQTESAASWEQNGGVTSLPLHLEPSGSVFVVFRQSAAALDPVVALARDGISLLPLARPEPKIRIQKAVYGVLNDPQRTRDVRAKVQRLVEAGEEGFQVAQMAEGEDPAFGIVKTLVVEYTVDDRRVVVRGQDPETVYLPEYAPQIQIEKAVYGVLGDAQRTRDVRAKVQHLVEAGEYNFQVSRLAQGDDPAVLVVKTLALEYTLGGRHMTVSATDPETVFLAQPLPPNFDRVAELHRWTDGRLLLTASQPGHYELKTASGKTHQFDVPALPPPVEVRGPWEVAFAPGGGAPEKVTFDRLISWPQHGEPGVKYFSGTATYKTRLTVSPDLLGRDRRIFLDLGKVQVMARVKLNGKDFGILWKAPFRLDVTGAVKPGINTLEVRVVNLWPNRMIADEQLPEDSERNPDGTLKAWPQWLQADQPSPAKRHTFTTWRLWKKDSPPLESGLIGPVTISTAAVRKM